MGARRRPTAQPNLSRPAPGACWPGRVCATCASTSASSSTSRAQSMLGAARWSARPARRGRCSRAPCGVWCLRRTGPRRPGACGWPAWNTTTAWRLGDCSQQYSTRQQWPSSGWPASKWRSKRTRRSVRHAGSVPSGSGSRPSWLGRGRSRSGVSGQPSRCSVSSGATMTGGTCGGCAMSSLRPPSSCGPSVQRGQRWCTRSCLTAHSSWRRGR
mmetsp:Transcript_40523/g.72518  ORF Transcript_40523/g.72518 Transcript_40523/m.72518 type:complete len:214 (+) Transcript_40523:949-1590(+)